MVCSWCPRRQVRTLRFDLGDNSISFKVDGVAYRTTDIQNYDDVRSSIWSTSLQEFVSDSRLIQPWFSDDIEKNRSPVLVS